MRHSSPSKILLLAFLLLASYLHASDRPNIVWLSSEDNTKDWLRLYNENGAAMPNLERLSTQSLVFENAYSNAPVCSVARTSLISGIYPPKIGAQLHRTAAMVSLPDNLKLFPSYLREAGYFTSNKSKTDYNVHGTEEWDESSRDASYRHREVGQPFFHVQNFGITHESSLHFSEEEMAEPTTKNPEDVELFPYHPDTEIFRYSYATYHDRHQQLDKQLGEFLDQLEADGLLDNTIIFYFGDNGGSLPRSKGYLYESGINVPFVLFVPEKWKHLVPTNPVGRTDAMVSFVDFGPTVLSLAGLPIPQAMDGRPFLGSSVSPVEFNERDTVYSSADRFDEKYDLVRAVREGRYKYIRCFQPYYYDGMQNNYRYKSLAYREWRDLYESGNLPPAQSAFFQPHPAEQLYDLQNDPHEIDNLAEHADYQATLGELRTLLENHIVSLPDLGLLPENYLVENRGDDSIAFAKAQGPRIKALLETANLALLPFEEAELKLAKALASSDPLIRYWALSNCSSFVKEADSLHPLALSIAEDSRETPLNRARAAEFLALGGYAQFPAVLKDALQEAKSETEAALILNTITFLGERTGTFAQVNTTWINPDWIASPKSMISQRLRYLSENGALYESPKNEYSDTISQRGNNALPR